MLTIYVDFLGCVFASQTPSSESPCWLYERVVYRRLGRYCAAAVGLSSAREDPLRASGLWLVSVQSRRAAEQILHDKLLRVYHTTMLINGAACLGASTHRPNAPPLPLLRLMHTICTSFRRKSGSSCVKISPIFGNGNMPLSVGHVQLLLSLRYPTATGRKRSVVENKKHAAYGFFTNRLNRCI